MIRKQGKIRCRERLDGLLKYYEREAAYTRLNFLTIQDVSPIVFMERDIWARREAVGTKRGNGSI